MRIWGISIVLLYFLGFSQIAAAREIVVSTFAGPSDLVLSAETCMREAYRRLGHSLKVIRFPGERSLITANSGLVDGELFRVAGIDNIYSNLSRIPLPIFTIEMVVFTKEKFFQVDGWKSLKPYTIGYRRGLKAIEFNLSEDYQTESATTYEQVFLMLDAGRFDVAIGSRTSGMQMMNRLKIDGISILETPLNSTKIYHYLHAKNNDLMGPLTRVLEQMEKEGLLKH